MLSLPKRLIRFAGCVNEGFGEVSVVDGIGVRGQCGSEVNGRRALLPSGSSWAWRVVALASHRAPWANITVSAELTYKYRASRRHGVSTSPRACKVCQVISSLKSSESFCYLNAVPRPHSLNMALTQGAGHRCQMLDLPPELVVRISSYLTTIELGNFRRSCKQVEAHLFATFAKEFFTKRQFMLEEHSLQALVDIANHPTLSKYLSYVIIASQQLNDIGTRSFRHNTRQASPQTLLWTGGTLDMLVEAFTKLDNLRTVGLRDYAGADRLRDGPHMRWRSYGWSAARDNNASYGAASHSFLDFPQASTYTFPLILKALSKASGNQVDALEVILRHDPKLEPDSFNILDGVTGKTVNPALANLRSIFLPVTFRSHHNMDIDWLLSMKDGCDHVEVPLRRLLCSLPKIEAIRLNFEQSEHHDTGRFLTWLGRQPSPTATSSATSASIPLSPPYPTMPHLTTLELGMLVVTGPDLVGAFARFDLRKFSLWRVMLNVKGRPRPIDPESGHWPEVLRDMSKALSQSSNLHSVMLGEFRQGESEDDGRRRKVETVVFTVGDGQDRAKLECERSARYRAGYGSNVRDWLDHLAERVYVPPAEPQRQQSSASEEDMEDGEDDDEDEDMDDDEEMEDEDE